MFELRFDMLVAGRAGAGGSFEGSLGGALLLPMLEGFRVKVRVRARFRVRVRVRVRVSVRVRVRVMVRLGS